MPQSGWAHEPWLLSLRIRSLCSATGEATTVRGPLTAKKKIKKKNTGKNQSELKNTITEIKNTLDGMNRR